MLDFELSTNLGLSFEAQSTGASLLPPSMTRKARPCRRRLFRHIIVSPIRTGVGWMVHEPSAVAKLRLWHDHPAASIERDGKLVSRRTHTYAKRLGVFCA